jgi:ABC-type transporter Mla subunit MlaD
MRTPITRFERATGAFLVAVSLLLAIAALASGRLGELLDLWREDFTILAVAADGYGVAVGSPVKVHDVEVGAVTKVELLADPSHPETPVRITIRIRQHAAAFLHDKTTALIVMPPLGAGMPPFGTSSVELKSAGEGKLAERAVIPAEGQESMVMTMARLSHDVSAMRDELTHAIGEMGSTFTNLRKLTDSLASGKGVAGRMMNDESLADALSSTLADARAATKDTRRLIADAQKMTEKAPAVIDDARATSRDARELLAKLNAAVDELPRVMAATERTLSLAEDLTDKLRTAAGHAPELARKVDSSLDETNRLVEAAQKNFLLRSTLPDRVPLDTESAVRPPVVFPDAGAP